MNYLHPSIPLPSSGVMMLNYSTNCEDLSITPLSDTVFFIRLLYGIPTIGLAVAVLRLVLFNTKRRKRYRSPFYWHLVHELFATMYMYFTHTLMMFLSRLPWFCPIFNAFITPSYWLTPYIFLHQSVHLLHLLSATTLALDRFRSLRKMKEVANGWGRSRFLASIGLITISLVPFVPITFSLSRTEIVSGNFFINYIHIFPWYSSNTIIICASFGCLAALILASVFSIKHIYKVTKSGSGLEYRLARVGFLQCGLIFIYVLPWIVLIALPRNWPGSVTMLTLTEPLTTDAIGMIPLWFLVYTNPRLLFDSFPSWFKNIRKRRQDNSSAVSFTLT